jgi:hypothetical protein
MRNDRTAIAELLLPYFPSMVKATSDEWHGFLNAQTGLDVGIAETNAFAFDCWRKALAEQGLPVWQYSPARIAEIQARGEELKVLEDKRREDMGMTLEQIAKEAPTITAEALIRGR